MARLIFRLDAIRCFSPGRHILSTCASQLTSHV